MSDKDDDDSDHGSPEQKRDNDEKSDAESPVHQIKGKPKDQDSSSSSSDDEEESSEDEDDDAAVSTSAASAVQTDEDGHALSEYELQRLERIRRNKEYLKQLGLEGGNLLPKKKKKAPSRKKRKPSVPAAAPRSSLSRSRKRRINYAEKPINQPTHKDNDVKPPSQKKKKKAPRMDRVVYDEFQRISSVAKKALRTAEMELRQAKVEHRHATRVYESFRKKESKRIDIEKRLEETARERKWLGGKTKKETLQHADRKMTEMLRIRALNERSAMAKREMEQWIEQRKDAERKMQMIDALDRFPNAMKEATNVLNLLLLERSPKDPPPPRRTPSRKKTRRSSGATEDIPVQDAVASEAVASMQAKDPPLSNVSSSEAAAPEAPDAKHPAMEATDVTTEQENQKKPVAKRKEFSVRNVGGWISPEFSASVKRTWLECDRPSPTYVPQVGDTVLYYPAGHHAFLKAHPDVLGKKTRNKLRMPLQERAKKAFQKKQKAAVSKEEEDGDNADQAVKKENATAKENAGHTATTESSWYNEKWISSDGDYPVICRVDKTHAEFPPDPNSGFKHVEKEDGGGVKVVWALPGEKPEEKKTKKKKKKKRRPPICLVVQLHPLCPVLPQEPALSIPPKFSVVTFPSKVSPFIVPFSWAYRCCYSLSVGNSVTPRKGDWIGKIVELNSSGNDCCSNSLDDITFPELLSALDSTGPEIFMRSLENALSTSKYKLPFLDVCAVTDCIITRLKSKASVHPNVHESNQEKLISGLIDLIRETLPRWNGVEVEREKKRNKCCSAWDLVQNNPDDGSSGISTIHVFPSLKVSFNPDNGLVSSLDEPLRAKIECTVEDFIKDTKDSSFFLSPVTDQVAPSYSCAVPLGMCFERILRRLKRDNRVGEGDARCYYRSVESIISDLNEIGYSCVLYNSPDSSVVSAVVAVIPACRKLISQVASRHMREKEVREKADDERRRLVLLQCDSSAQIINQSEQSKSSRRKSLKKKKASLSFFTTPLSRKWIQSFHPDQSWRQCAGESVRLLVNGTGSESIPGTGVASATRSSTQSGPDTTQREGVSSKKSSTFWVPQSGDVIFYSRSLHAQFVKSHYRSLTTEQCMLPLFQKGQGGDDTTTGEENSAIISAEDSNVVDPRHGHNGWIVGKVLWVRPSFPQDPASDKEVNTFEEVSPVLSLGISFDDSWMGKPIQTIFWRPCVLETENQDSVDIENDRNAQNSGAHLSPAKGSSSVSCDVCGLGKKTSFLRPSWIPYDGTDGKSIATGILESNNEGILFPDGATSVSICYPPAGLPSEEVAAIDRCFILLKTRSLGNIPADYIDPKFCMDNVKRGWYPVVKTSTRLPSFENLLQGETGKLMRRKKPAQTIQTRGVSTSLEETQTLLSAVHYLPLWASKSSYFANNGLAGQNGESQGIPSSLQHYEKIAPNPNQCLELVQLRLRNGYYRQKAALIYDIQEAYVTSVLQKLSQPSLQGKRKNISVLKIARALNFEDGAVEYATARDTSSPSRTKAVPTSKKKKLSEEELQCKKRIEQVRKLYATAIVCASETGTVERIFGTAPQHRSKQKRVSAGVAEQDRVNAVIRGKVDCLLSALSRDPCYNRLPSLASTAPLPTVKIKILWSGSADQENPPDSLPLANLDHHNRKGSHGEMCDAENDEEPLPDMSKPILFDPGDYVSHQTLVRTFFGRPGRMEACARCQASRRSMITCRVRKGHSNADFDWIDCFRGVGGVDSLIEQLANPSTENITTPSGSSSTVSIATAGNDGGPTCTSVETVASQASASIPNKPDVVSESLPAAAVTSADECEKGATVPGTDSAPKPEQLHPLVIRERAQIALDLANDAVLKATAAVNSSPKLSEKFIRENFPVDPVDGHYNYCIVCGLSGDVLCCEGCANVSHPHCANLATVPEGDWYCSKCVMRASSTQSPDRKQSPNQNSVGDNTKDNSESEANDPNRETEEANTENISGEEPGGTTSDMEISFSSLLGRSAPLVLVSDILEELRFIRVGGDQQAESAGKDAQESTEPAPEAGRSQDDDLPEEIKVGAKIRKTFENHGDFEGVVTKLPSSQETFYEVRYEDGDKEDMSEDELRSHLLPSKPETEAPESDKKQKKGRPSAKRRGRPPKNTSPEKKSGSEKKTPRPRKRGRPRKDDGSKSKKVKSSR